ncbi:RsmB/NOP family class I SAM-dependent RNA methyltransferase [Sulfitobacter aestuarii]|uniref:RsmB/NOP family class I SAM-dependent RNA methyltransferase n=1 Tax=Sulfitobacter aestuarii TaxID=2161676 RepID=A0ABW5U061_9RHOB
MTPGARVAAAIGILDQIGEGLAGEQALTRWARGSRFAGSKDRAAVRDHVFDVLRCRRSAAHFGRGEDGRALMIGMLRQSGADLPGLFNGVGHSADPLSEAELNPPGPIEDLATAWNLPDWLVPLFQQSLGEAAEPTALALQERAPITLRVNTAKTDIASSMRRLSEEGITTVENPLCASALNVTGGARKIRNSASFRDGEIEFQDAASQAVVAAIPTTGKVLDYCAGGGGKALALATQGQNRVSAHDIDPRRMSDLPARAERAAVRIRLIATDALRAHAPFDIVLCDAPCSGSGAWRRSPEGKWSLTATRLQQLTEIQDEILDRAAPLLARGGVLVYATCSVLRIENEDRVTAFLQRHPDWICSYSRRFAVDNDGDGFFTAHLTRN